MNDWDDPLALTVDVRLSTPWENTDDEAMTARLEALQEQVERFQSYWPMIRWDASPELDEPAGWAAYVAALQPELS